jgi:hypothetical protein
MSFVGLRSSHTRYESQQSQLYGQVFNMEQLSFAQESAKDTLVQVQVMKDSAKALKKEFKQMDINKIEVHRIALFVDHEAVA